MQPMGAPLDGLDEEQRAAASAVTGPVCIVAGAGTGKTRTVTRRLAHALSIGAVRPGTALAVTHSRKAAGELGKRLSELGAQGVEARTFHAAGRRIVTKFWQRTGRPESSPDVLDDRATWRMWRQPARAATKGDPDNALVRDLIDEVGWARSQLLQPEGYVSAAVAKQRHPGIDLDGVVAGWTAFEGAKQREGKVDFADMLELGADLLLDHADVAGAVRGRWSHVTVDEYQDTDPAQQRLLDAILGDSRDICVVGDPRQAIYSFKGADSSYLTGFEARYPDARIFPLTRNYRSSPEIIAWANAVASNSWSKPLVGTRPPGTVPKAVELNTEAGEATWVAKEVQKALAAGTPPSEVAVLYRFNAMQARFETALAEAGVATVVVDDTTFFDREEVKAVLRPFGQRARAEPDRAGAELLGSLLTQAGFDRDRPPEGMGAARQRWESLAALLELVEFLPESDKGDARSLLRTVNDLATRTHGPRDDGVTLATLHRAKGMEWDVVFIVGLTDGTLPAKQADTPRELAEEARLFHVGLSRARHMLYVSWGEHNTRGWTSRPSPFLDLLPRRSRASSPEAGRVRARSGTAGQGRRRADTAVTTTERGGPTCHSCAEPLKGMSARRLGICAHCVVRAPGEVGARARRVDEVTQAAARESGTSPEGIVSPSGLLRLLDQRPKRPEDVAATAGVNVNDSWAQAVAEALVT
jgi:DNA helicase II / ATP-dependent DNA helicase PcrA